MYRYNKRMLSCAIGVKSCTLPQYFIILDTPLGMNELVIHFC
jgi:hypothetical protein